MLVPYNDDDLMKMLFKSKKKESDKKRWLARNSSRDDERRRALVAAGQQRVLEGEHRTFEMNKSPNGYSIKATWTRVRQILPALKARPETFCVPFDDDYGHCYDDD